MSAPKLFQPIQIGDLNLQHRVVLAPLTRQRANPMTAVPQANAKTYYVQRASAHGTLLITEGTLIAAKAGGRKGAPGIWSDEQTAAWKEITDAVHAAGSFIFMQLWALGRAAFEKEFLDPSFAYVSASDIHLEGRPNPPRPLSGEEIKEYIESYTIAAKNAVEKAGFDGVEVHGANGYIVDQFIQDVTNKRTDEYGGSLEKRARFALEVIDSIASAIGPEKTAIRLSPWSIFQGEVYVTSGIAFLSGFPIEKGMRMDDPVPTFSYLVKKLKENQPNLAYIHLIEPRMAGNAFENDAPDGNNDIFRDIWAPKPVITAGGFSRESAMKRAEEHGDLIAFGRYFISNPDIVKRLKLNIPLNKYDRSTFYVPGDASARGYTDYSFSEDI